jgi:hypothetical protein
MNPLLYGPLDASNFDTYARAAYQSDLSDGDEFDDDLRRIRYIKKALSKYAKTGELKPILILNHLVIWYNVFQPEIAATKLLVFRLVRELEQLKPFLVLLGKWPERIAGLGYGRETIWGSDIPMDSRIIAMLRQLPAKRGTDE